MVSCRELHFVKTLPGCGTRSQAESLRLFRRDFSIFFSTAVEQAARGQKATFLVGVNYISSIWGLGCSVSTGQPPRPARYASCALLA